MELLSVAFVLLVLYGLVRLFANGMAALTGARHRAYRQLAARYRGRYESRGLVDPPTVSFSHNGSSVRVGLAPVIPGQPSAPRTRVVARFAEGLPFRLELVPHRRPAPTQPPKGTRPVTVEVADFDRLYAVHANDPEMARAFLQGEAMRSAIEALRRLAPPSGVLVSINPERLLVQVDRNLGLSTVALDTATREALILHDGLKGSVASRLQQGIEIVGSASSAQGVLGLPECTVCGDPIEGPHVQCAACHTPFHQDCWSFVGACSTFGCTGKSCVRA
jgi:hypothetical protein